MKTVWNVLSDNEIMDYPCVQTFANKVDALKMAQELFGVYCDEHEIDPHNPNHQSVENISDGKYYRFMGGEWEEWVYVLETEIVPSTAHSGVLEENI